MTTLDVTLDQEFIGVLDHTAEDSYFTFNYAPAWQDASQRYPLSPYIPLSPPAGQTPAQHSVAIRHFFENLLPEGRALEEAAAANKISKSNLVGLMIALGRETAGAVALKLSRQTAAASSMNAEADGLRRLSREELSSRIKARPYEPFSVWDGKVRLSIAGFQDKLAVYKEGEDWYLIDSGRLASTVILKPEPIARNLAGLTSNEFFCMRLARNAGLSVANVRLIQVPEPVLEIDRYDRVRTAERVRRIHAIDGCQFLNIPSANKYERPFGSGEDVKNIRDGASLPQLFAALQACTSPAAERLRLLRWTIFQILIGNTDAHAKNISFFNDDQGLRQTPTYDLVSILAYADSKMEDTFAMAIGDAFTQADLSPLEWALFAQACGLSQRLVANELASMSAKVQKALDETSAEVILEGAEPEVIQKIVTTVKQLAARQRAMAKAVGDVDPALLR